jgi:hypothetical protein
MQYSSFRISSSPSLPKSVEDLTIQPSKRFGPLETLISRLGKLDLDPSTYHPSIHHCHLMTKEDCLTDVMSHEDHSARLLTMELQD